MKVLIEKEVADDRFDEVIEKAVQASLNKLSVDEDCEVSVTLTDNIGIKELNKQFRNIDRETDVLSFPILAFDEEGNRIEDEADYDDGRLILGDVVISVEKAESQAKEYGHSIYREVGFLTVHSMLHLLGYDHMESTEAQVMEKLQEEILREMNLTRED